jgi:D-arginine dehydrogenase
MVYDVAIIGAGMAGASLAAELHHRQSVILIEAEDQPGFHATGRSAAFWDECYGGLDVQPLTTASGPLLQAPSEDFASDSFLRPRGSLYIGRSDDEAGLRAFYSKFTAQGVRLEWLDHDQMLNHIPGLRTDWCFGVRGPDCSDIDVAALHQAYLRKAKRNAVDLALRARLMSASRSNDIWSLQAGNETIEARIVVNATGAWANDIARLCNASPIQHNPFRRTVAQVQTAPLAPSFLPLVIDYRGQFYFKPEGQGRLWLSPHDETPSLAMDVAAEEMDVATAIDRLENATDWKVERVERSWAGLRTFSPDRKPVFGFDPNQPSFFWCTGQGGFGIQTAPAAAKLCAALIEERSLPEDLKGIDPAAFAPGRFIT